MFADQVSPLEHLNARDTSFALVSRPPQPLIERFAQRMGCRSRYTVIGEGFQRARGTTEYFALDVFLRDGERVFLTYVGERVRVGQTVKMHVRDGASADEDLRGALRARRRSRPPAG